MIYLKNLKICISIIAIFLSIFFLTGCFEKQEDVKLTGQSADKFEQKNPEVANKAKEEVNKKEGYISYSTPEEKKQADQQFVADGTNYYNQVVSYYQSHGDVSGIPSELQLLFFNGNQLEDSKTLKDYNIPNMSTLHFALKKI